VQYAKNYISGALAAMLDLGKGSGPMNHAFAIEGEYTMNEKKTSVFSNGLIWFGAGVSIAEILTGTYFAPLGFGKAMAAILLGHLIGGLMMFAAGMIGARERRSAMETVKMSFGEKGSLLFAALNVLQLVGWTAIMIYIKITLNNTSDRINNAVIATVLSFPRLVSPIRIQRIMRTPIMAAQNQFATGITPLGNDRIIYPVTGIV